MNIHKPGCCSFVYTKNALESPKLCGYISKKGGLIITSWTLGPYDKIVKELKLR